MNRRLGFSFFLFSTLTISAYGQWTAQDSLNLKKFLSGDSEIKLNPNAINNILLESPTINLKPMMQSEKPSLKFRTDLPSYFTDSIFRNKRIYLTLRPYSAFTRYNENPAGRDGNYIQPMATKVRFRQGTQPSNYTTSPSISGMGGPFRGGAAGVVGVFSMEDLLQSIFSKKGRARMHNAKNANAWKKY